MWYGATVRSTIPRGLIRSIGFDRNIDWNEFTVVTAADIPGENRIQHDRRRSALPRRRQGQSLRRAHPAHRAPRQAQGPRSRKRRAHRIRTAAARLHHRRKRRRQDRSSGARTTASKASCSKKATSTPHGPTPRTSLKANTAPARRNICTSKTTASSPSTARRAASPCGARCSAPIYVHKSLLAVFDLPDEKVRVIQTETGGAFGGKEDYPSDASPRTRLCSP